MSKMTALEKVTGCMALLIHLCMKDTVATKFTMTSENVSYKGEILGDYKITIEKIK